MAVPETAGENLALRRKRLRYRAWHRGTREMDLVLGPFADIHLETFDAAHLDRLEALMEESDIDLLSWVMGQSSPPQGVDLDLLERITAHHRNERPR